MQNQTWNPTTKKKKIYCLFLILGIPCSNSMKMDTAQDLILFLLWGKRFHFIFRRHSGLNILIHITAPSCCQLAGNWKWSAVFSSLVTIMPPSGNLYNRYIATGQPLILFKYMSKIHIPNYSVCIRPENSIKDSRIW